MPAASPCRWRCVTAASIMPSCRRMTADHRRRTATPSPALQRVNSPFRAGVPQLERDGGPCQGGDAECLGRRRIHRAGRLYRFQLRQPVQQVRPHLPGLCAGGCEISRCGRDDIEKLYVRSQDNKMVPLGALVQIQRDGRPVADQPLQSVSHGEHRRRAGARLQLRPGDDR